ncbi:hypothetical protein BC835DRAFT_1314125 [Cytidiella melzeri]|nr:hypothetical protein BC835DRAFT_1314125 [Cytidiella melzeri]
MSAAATSPPAHLANSAVNHQQLVFDFTKRKRWADLLVSELTEAIMLVLSQTGQVWYCGPAVEELLGWKDEEVIDTNFCDIMNADDRATFQRQFTESVQNRSDLLAYARLRCKTSKDLYPSLPAPQPVGLTQTSEDPTAIPKEVLFEINGYPHFVAGSDSAPGVTGFNTQDIRSMNSSEGTSRQQDDIGTSFKCFFAMAKPYPSRNTAMLNTFLELKLENERLQARLQAAKAKAESMDILTAPPGLSRTAPPATTTPSPSYHPTGQSLPYTFPPHVSQSRNSQPPSYSTYEPPGLVSGSASSQPLDEDLDSNADSGSRKKNKRATGTEMYVCTKCGRTDSPEWRKGPNGPKTLCNACGLRWAKSNRGPKEPSSAVSASSRNSQHTVGGTNTSGSLVRSESSTSTSSGTLASAVGPSTAGAGTGGGPGAPYMSLAFDHIPDMITTRWYSDA